LAEFTLNIPPLRKRLEDLSLLAQYFQEEASTEFRRNVTLLSGEAAMMLMAHSWPGNVRELRNIIRQAVLLTPDSCIHKDQIKDLLGKKTAGESIGPVAVPLPSGLSLKQIAETAVEEAEKQAIRA